MATFSLLNKTRVVWYSSREPNMVYALQYTRTPCCHIQTYPVLHHSHTLIRLLLLGMLTITDFIIILHRYYKSPMVRQIQRNHLQGIFLHLFSTVKDFSL